MAENRTVKVTLKAEIASYVANMMRGAKATEDLGSAAAGASSDIERAMAQSEKASKSGSAGLERLGKVAARTAAAVVLAFGAFAGAMLVQGVNANSAAEQNTLALETMLGSAEAAKVAMQDVTDLATETPFQLPVLTDQYKTFVSARMELGKIIPLMHAYSAAVAASGGDSSKLQQVADVFAKIQTLGKAGAEELNSLALANIPVWDYMADAAGVSIDEVRRQVSEGMWDSARTIDTVTAAMEQQYGGMLDKMGDSFARWQDKLKGAQRRTAEQMAVPIMEVGKEIMRSLTAMFNESTRLLKEVDWAPLTEPLMSIPAAIDDITASMGDGGLQGIVNGVGKGFELFAAAGELAISIALPMADTLSNLVSAAAPLRDVLTGIMELFNSLPEPVKAGIAALAMVRMLNGPFTNLIQTVTATTTATRAAVTEHIRASQQLLVGAAAANTATGAHGRLSATLIGTRAAFSTVGVAAKTAGTAIMGAFGGPVGLGLTIALTAISVATSAWTGEQRKAEEAALAHAQAVDAVAASLDKETGAATESTVNGLAMRLKAADLVPVLEAAGVGVEEFSAAVYGGAEAQEAFKAKLDESLQDPALQKYLADNKMSIEEFAKYLASNPMAANSLGLDHAAVSAVRAWAALTDELGISEDALQEIEIKAAAAAGAAGFIATPTVNTVPAESALKSLRDAATRALSSFVTLAPQKKKSGGGGGGGSKGEDPEVKRLKAEQKALKKRTDAEKKAASDYEKLMRERSQAAQEAARAAEDAARDAADAETSALDKSKRAIDAYTSAQRQRAAIQRTLDAGTDPVRRAQLQQALNDALAHEAAALDAKTIAEREAAQAVLDNQAAKELSKTTTEQAIVAETDYKKASEESAAVQERTAAQIEAVSERLAVATEAAADRMSGAMSGATEELTESLDEWIARMWEEIEAQNQWLDDMAWLATQTNGTVVAAFTEMGQSGFGVLRELRENGGAELESIEQLFAARASGIGEAMLVGFNIFGDIGPVLTAKYGKAAADELLLAMMAGKVSVEQIMQALQIENDGQHWTINIDADTDTAIASASSLVNYIQGLRPTMTISTVTVGGVEKGVGSWARRALGGAITGPGPKGRDSVPILAAPGEHVLTASEVDAMGGQSGVYAFRKSLRGGDYPADVSAAVAGSALSPRAGTTIKQTIYYPQAEPSSKAAIRADRWVVG